MSRRCGVILHSLSYVSTAQIVSGSRKPWALAQQGRADVVFDYSLRVTRLASRSQNVIM